MRRHASTLRKFAAVGAAGFVVDSASLYVALWAGAGLYFGRALSYLVAATVTWALNRHYTFAVPDRPSIGEWSRFVLANLTGGLVNYAIYAAAVTCFAFFAAYPALAVGLGSLSGLAVNYSASRSFVFRRSMHEPSS
jgi:putative flippase GtrA